jgi:ABC-type branched-subunit amino acid transport system ATPase component
MSDAGRTATKHLLEAISVSKSFGEFHAVAGADLTVNEGDIIGLIGPNGAGKSTFFNCLAGEMPPSGIACARRHRPHFSSADHVCGYERASQCDGRRLSAPSASQRCAR